MPTPKQPHPQHDDIDLLQLQLPPSTTTSTSTSNPSNNLLNLIPPQIRTKYTQNCNLNIHECIYLCFYNLHQHTKVEELVPLFEEIGADLNVWLGKTLPEEKGEYLLDMLEKNVQDGLKKVNAQASSYMTLIQSNRKLQKNGRLLSQKQKNNEFDWLVLNTKNQMLKSKLKTKLVQTINQFKNEKKLRQVMGKQLQDHEKIHLQDESIDLYQDDKTKMTYEWTAQDEQMFLHNIKMLRQKFNQTQFLKNCHRYKFITYSQLKTLAAQQISRKLDKSNKAFLSRQFLLDKYFSTKENLTEKQMKFILKTSPLLSRCVDKSFVRAAIKNIQYEDIDKMELQIAEEIIEKFEMIRNLVKNSRKSYKQKQNNKVKKRIQIFQKQKQQSLVRQNMGQKFNHHKTKMIRNLNFRPSSTKNSNFLSKNKQNYDSIHDKDTKAAHKFVWPVPLNSNHPATGLFIKDCSQQLNDQFNQYEKSYIRNLQRCSQQNYTKKSPETQAAMMKFYTGGPIDNGFQNKTMTLSSTCVGSFNRNSKNYKADGDVIKAICEAFKTSQHRKDLMNKLNSIDLIDSDQDESFTDKRTFSFGKSIIDFYLNESTKRTKKMVEDDEMGLSGSQKLPNTTEKVIKEKIIEGKQKAKMKVYVKKLHSLAAENSFLSLKALNAKFTPSQINSYDNKGNTALYYATKHKNSDFIDYLLAQKADVNIRCSKGTTPLHNAFRSSNYAIICKCLSGAIPPNLNVLDDQGKTPLAYCCRKILQMLGLQDGVVCVAPGQKLKFNNTSLLCLMNPSNQQSDKLQVKFDIKNKSISKQKSSTNL